jgi:hypothetical protein
LEIIMYCLAEVNWEAVFQPGNVMFMGIFGVGGLVGAISIGGGIYMAMKKHQRDVLLKRDMVAKGYSAEEIAQVLSAKSPRN